LASTKEELETRIAALKTAYDNIISGEVASYTMPNGIVVTRHNPESLLRQIDKLESQLQPLIDAEDIAAGLGNPNKIRTRF